MAEMNEPNDALVEDLLPDRYSTPSYHPMTPSADGVIRILPYTEGDDALRE